VLALAADVARTTKQRIRGGGSNTAADLLTWRF